jgi:hypothetical protein
MGGEGETRRQEERRVGWGGGQQQNNGMTPPNGEREDIRGRQEGDTVRDSER